MGERTEMTRGGDRIEYVDVNPGMSGFAFAMEDERVRGVCVGVLGIKPVHFPLYEGYHGRHSARPPEAFPDIVVCSLPFSPFVRASGSDPAVGDLVALAARASVGSRKVKGAKAVLFRAPWVKAETLGAAPGEYVDAVKAAFPAEGWTFDHAVSVHDGSKPADVFVAAVRGDVGKVFSLPIPADVARRHRHNPQEKLAALGYPLQFALHNAGVAVTLVEDIVSIKAAGQAILQVLEAVGRA
jgi:hypothetical protein